MGWPRSNRPFVDELAVIMGWGFRHMQGEAGEGGSVYLRLSTRTLDQPQRIMAPELQRDITEGAYWLREPGPNCDIVIAYTGAVAPEAIEAVGFIGESHRDVGLLAVTSATGCMRDGPPRGICGASAVASSISAMSKNCWRRCRGTAAS
jgi:pyruvate dehydrogenase complex dehydrogenase (E1) component